MFLPPRLVGFGKLGQKGKCEGQALGSDAEPGVSIAAVVCETCANSPAGDTVIPCKCLRELKVSEET